MAIQRKARTGLRPKREAPQPASRRKNPNMSRALCVVESYSTVARTVYAFMINKSYRQVPHPHAGETTTPPYSQIIHCNPVAIEL